jgi:hypothetical protein
MKRKAKAVCKKEKELTTAKAIARQDMRAGAEMFIVSTLCVQNANAGISIRPYSCGTAV